MVCFPSSVLGHCLFLFNLCVLFISLNFDIIQTKFFILLKSPLVSLRGHVWIRVWRVEALDVRVGQWVIEDDCERSFNSFDLQLQVISLPTDCSIVVAN